MYVVCIHIHVQPEHRESFIQASLANAQATVKEPGNLRFDVLQRADDPNRFMLYEVYRDESGMDAHKQTAHYAKWRDSVGAWMKEPRQAMKYADLFPTTAEAWKTCG
jgi:autoinducer 2-degrading protein